MSLATHWPATDANRCDVDMRLSVVVPFHGKAAQLRQTLVGIRRSAPSAELIVVADGLSEDCESLVAEAEGRLVQYTVARGPGAARNLGARVARGRYLAFVDADVVVSPDALEGLCNVLDAEPDLAGVFGSYDLAPADQGFWSQYKNLSHAYVHQESSPEAWTFWAGLGVLRASAFWQVGGFDERLTQPSIEDIELGRRIVAAGFRLRLDPRWRGCHLKVWSLRSSVVTEICRRGVPWAQLLLRTGAASNDLNLRWHLRWSAMLSALGAVLLTASAWMPELLLGSSVCLVATTALNWRYYHWFAEQRGIGFAVRVIPAHLLHHLCNVVSLVTALVLHAISRCGGELPGTLPRARPVGVVGEARRSS